MKFGSAEKEDVSAYRAIELTYHSYLTGLILLIASRAGPAHAAEVVFRTFRRQQLARFVPGLKKLGLDKLPSAVACAQYHYLSNRVGGVKVEYVYESDHKAWVRYPPPRWIWSGTAICGIPSEVSRAMLQGWHANNAVVLGNQVRGAPEVEIGERCAEIGHERLDVGAAAAGLMQRIFEQHVGSGDLVDDTKIDGLAPEFGEPTTNDGLVIILFAH